MKKEINVIARGVCVKDGKLLLCHTKGADNTYLPGGHVEFQENAIDALAREIVEELGVEGRVGVFLGAVEHAFIQHGKPKSELNLLFELQVDELDSNKVPESCEDHIEFMWADVSDLGGVRLEPAVLDDCMMEWLKADHSIQRWASNV